MKICNIADFKGGWFVGDFTPNLYQTKDFECAVKNYKKGDYEKKHYHKIAIEVTVIVSGKVEMNGVEYQEGTVIVIEPGEATDFRALEDTKNVVVKIPSVIGDKYEVEL